MRTNLLLECVNLIKKFDWIFVISTFSRRQFDIEGQINLELYMMDEENGY